jgi:hypothetical protein
VEARARGARRHKDQSERLETQEAEARAAAAEERGCREEAEKTRIAEGCKKNGKTPTPPKQELALTAVSVDGEGRTLRLYDRNAPLFRSWA